MARKRNMEGVMESFLDSCIVINFLEYNEFQGILKEKSYEYVKLHQKDILICVYVLKEIRRYIRKKEIQLNEVIRKKKNPSYTFGTDKETLLLNKKELLFAEQLYESLVHEEILLIEKRFEEDTRTIRLKLNILLKKIKEILRENEINQNLVSILHEFIKDYSDCKVLSIALQIQQNREPFLFVTCDKHIDPNGYDFIKNDSRLKDYKFPELKNLLFEK